MMTNVPAYIRRETTVSTVINTVLSVAFFCLAFGLHGVVTVAGAGGYLADFVPQGFMIGLMATLVPGVLAGKALRAGKVAAWPGQSRLPRKLFVRSLVMALASAALATVAAGVVLTLTGTQSLPWSAALAGKIVTGALLAVVVTPPGLRAALCRQTED